MRRPFRKSDLAVLCVVGGVLLASVCWRIYQKNEFRKWVAQRDRVEHRIVKLHPSEQRRIPEDKWNAAIGHLQAAIWNACYSPATVSTEELADLEQRVQAICNRSNIDYETLVDIWHAIGETNDAAKRYTNGSLAYFLEILKVLGRKAPSEPVVCSY